MACMSITTYRGDWCAADCDAALAGWTPLTYAIANGSVRFTKALIKAGAQVASLLPGQLAYPLHVAADRGDTELIKLCLDARADVNQIGLDRATALAIAAAHAPKDKLEELMNVPGSEGSTALKCAVVNGQVEAVRLLIDRRADISAVRYPRANPSGLG